MNFWVFLIRLPSHTGIRVVNNLRRYISIFFFALPGAIYAQGEVLEKIDFENTIENLLPQQELDVNYSDLYDRLFSLYSEPLNLNTAERTDLQSLFFLTDNQIDGILDYREKYGKFMTIYELMSIEGFDKEIVQHLMPFVTISAGVTKFNIAHPSNHDLFIRYQSVLERKKGYTLPDTLSNGRLTSRYAGGPARFYARYNYARAGQYSFGFTIEKDPGELITWDPGTSRYGMDYYSFHAMIENRGIFKRVILGDFTMDFGQGLVFGSGFRLGKGMEPVTTVRRNNFGVRPYRSVYENKDFSGVAVSMSLRPAQLTLFYSHVRRDGILRTDSRNEIPFISYIQTVGLHRTPSEIQAKDKLADNSWGFNLNFKLNKEKLEIGFNGIYTNYSHRILPQKRKYNQFYFQGISNAVGSLYFNYYMRNAHFFGDFAMSDNGGVGISSGIIASLTSNVQVSLHVRNYDKQFHSFYGNAFGESTTLINEQGVYWGIKVMPFRNLILSAYYDFFRFPWLKYRVDAPSRGNDLMLALSCIRYNKFDLRAQFRSKTKEYNYYEEGQNYPHIEPMRTKRLWADFRYHFNKNLNTKTRLQFTSVQFGEKLSRGFLLAQDVNYSKAKYSLSARVSYFDSDDYNSRQFIYERDLLYVYSIPSFYNQGVRYYLVFKYEVLRNISCWIKFGQTHFFNINKIGSGLETIDGATRTDLSAQLRIRFY